jgi:uncharacterized protein
LFHVQETEQTEYYSSLAPPAEPSILRPPSPDNPPWSSGMAIALWGFSVLLILVVPAVFLLPYVITAFPGSASDPDTLSNLLRNDKTAILLQVAGILPAHLLTLLAAFFVVTRKREFSFREMLGWSSGGTRWWVYPAILIGFLAIAGVFTVYVPEEDNDLLRILRSSREAVYLVAIMATFTAPIVEEVIYRGVVYSAFQRSMGVTAAFLLVTALFAVVHVPQYYPSVSTIVLLTLLSVTLTAIRVFSGNLLPCIILHTLFNGFQSIMLIIEPWLPTGEVPPVDPATILRLIQ